MDYFKGIIASVIVIAFMAFVCWIAMWGLYFFINYLPWPTF